MGQAVTVIVLLWRLDNTEIWYWKPESALQNNKLDLTLLESSKNLWDREKKHDCAHLNSQEKLKKSINNGKGLK